MFGSNPVTLEVLVVGAAGEVELQPPQVMHQ